jgi:outer membrane protein TolC
MRYFGKARMALQRGFVFGFVCGVAMLWSPQSSAQIVSGPESTAPISLTLSQAVSLALKQNRNLLLADLALDDSEHKREISRSSYYPQIKNESSLLHITELAGIDIPAGTFGVPAATGPIPAKALFIGQGSHTSYTSGTGLTQPLTQLFKIHALNRAAATDVDIAKIQVDQTENEIALKVRQLYYGILIVQLRQQAVRAEISAGETKNQESKDAVAQGQSLDVAALQSHAALLEAQQAGLTLRLQSHDLTLALSDMLGLPLRSQLVLDDSSASLSIAIPSREECLRIAQQQSTEIRTAEQAVFKAKAGLSAAKDEYIPNVTGMARYSYQSGVPLLVHNFGTFGLNLSYDLFDGGRRGAQIRDSRTLVSEAELGLAQSADEVTVAVETAYDKVEQLQSMVEVAQEALSVRTEAARLADRQFEQTEALASEREEAHAKAESAKASFLEETINLSLAQADLKRTIGQIPQ